MVNCNDTLLAPLPQSHNLSYIYQSFNVGECLLFPPLMHNNQWWFLRGFGDAKLLAMFHFTLREKPAPSPAWLNLQLIYEIIITEGFYYCEEVIQPQVLLVAKLKKLKTVTTKILSWWVWSDGPSEHHTNAYKKWAPLLRCHNWSKHKINTFQCDSTRQIIFSIHICTSITNKNIRA